MRMKEKRIDGENRHKIYFIPSLPLFTNIYWPLTVYPCPADAELKDEAWAFKEFIV